MTIFSILGPPYFSIKSNSVELPRWEVEWFPPLQILQGKKKMWCETSYMDSNWLYRNFWRAVEFVGWELSMPHMDSIQEMKSKQDQESTLESLESESTFTFKIFTTKFTTHSNIFTTKFTHLQSNLLHQNLQNLQLSYLISTLFNFLSHEIFCC